MDHSDFISAQVSESRSTVYFFVSEMEVWVRRSRLTVNGEQRDLETCPGRGVECDCAESFCWMETTCLIRPCTENGAQQVEHSHLLQLDAALEGRKLHDLVVGQVSDGRDGGVQRKSPGHPTENHITRHPRMSLRFDVSTTGSVVCKYLSSAAAGDRRGSVSYSVRSNLRSSHRSAGMEDISVPDRVLQISNMIHHHRAGRDEHPFLRWFAHRLSRLLVHVRMGKSCIILAPRNILGNTRPQMTSTAISRHFERHEYVTRCQSGAGER